MYALAMLSARFLRRAGAAVLWVHAGRALEFALLRRLAAPTSTPMLVMIGPWIALQKAEQTAWTGVAKSIDNPFPAPPLVIGRCRSAGTGCLFCVLYALSEITYWSYKKQNSARHASGHFRIAIRRADGHPRSGHPHP